jgi:hypothetical protein
MTTGNITHFIYPYIIPRNPVFAWELMYSLRSLHYNFLGKYDVTIIGEIPDWVNTQKVRCIRLDNSDPEQFPRVQSRTNQKILVAADMYENIVLMHDDFYLINSCDLDTFKTIRYIDDNLNYDPINENGLTRFQRQVRSTYFRLKELQKPNKKNFALHGPLYFESEKLKLLNDYFDLTSTGEYSVIIENAYYNYFEVESQLLEKDYRVGFWGPSKIKNIENFKILNHDERGFFTNPWILDYLQKKFPKKSPLEL